MAYLGNNLQVAYSSYRILDNISSSFDGNTTTFALKAGGVTPTPIPISEQQLLISIGGVPQQPDPSGTNGFKLSAGNIIFSSAPSAGEKFWGVILAGADYVSAGTIYADGSVSAPAITFGSQITTGLYRSGSNQLAVALNGTNPVTFTTNGLQLNGSSLGTVTVAAPSAAGNNTLTLPTSNGSTYQIVRNSGTAGSLEFADKIVSGTAQNSTSGTSIDFTGIPSWVKRVTVIFNGVSTNGTSSLLIQIGTSSGFTTSGYASNSCSLGQSGTTGYTASTAGFSSTTSQQGATNSAYAGNSQIALLGNNTWIASSVISSGPNGGANYSAGTVALSGTLDRVRITTVSGTDTFDAGSINIFYE